MWPGFPTLLFALELRVSVLMVVSVRTVITEGVCVGLCVSLLSVSQHPASGACLLIRVYLGD